MDESKRLMRKMAKVKPFNNVQGRIIGYCPLDQKWWIGGEICAWFSENELEIVHE